MSQDIVKLEKRLEMRAQVEVFLLKFKGRWRKCYFSSWAKAKELINAIKKRAWKINSNTLNLLIPLLMFNPQNFFFQLQQPLLRFPIILEIVINTYRSSQLVTSLNQNSLYQATDPFTSKHLSINYETLLKNVSNSPKPVTKRSFLLLHDF